ncbi:type I DNA topoisomerase, partial [bacterium]|nr:type I DNA topoisomerase [bacterium]
MSKSLVIVESPAKAKTIGKYLGKDYIVKSSVGHIRDLPVKRFGIDVKNKFAMEYETIKGKEKVITELKESAAKVEQIYLAADPDREGEAICWHISEILKGKKNKDKEIYRVLFYEVTKTGVTEAFKNPGQINMDKVNAQVARRILDRIVGYEISPLLSRRLKRKGTNALSAGRVQSVALKMIVDREAEIQQFVPIEYWSITSNFKTKEGKTFPAKLHSINKKILDIKKFNISSKEEVDKILSEIKKAEFIVSEIKKKKVSQKPAAPFITSKLQQEAFVKLGFSSKKTMTIAQNLYEGVELGSGDITGLITYMRTDSTRISKVAEEEVREHIIQEYGKKYLPEKPRIYKVGKAAQEAHEAIRPTSVSYRPSEIKRYLTPEQFKLYDLIWRRFVASQMEDAIFDQTSVDIFDGKKYLFRATSIVPVFDGFLAVYQEGNVDAIDKKDDEDKDFELPKLSVKELLKMEQVTPKQHFTKPPPRYSEGSLVKALDEKGIGRPSTYSAILSKIMSREYVHIEKRRFIPTELGIIVTKMLTTSFPRLMNEKFTADMESELDQIETGKLDWLQIMNDFYEKFEKRLDDAKKDMRIPVEETDIPCDICGALMVIKWGKTKRFLSCSKYPDCSNAKNFEIEPESGKIIVKRDEETDILCDKCGAKMIIKSGRGGKKFLSCSNYPECKNAQNLKIDYESGAIAVIKAEETDIDCDKCGAKMIIKTGRSNKKFLSCSNYPECKNAKNFTMDDETGEIKIVKDEETDIVCDKCEAKMIIKTGRGNKKFLSCSNYPECKNAKSFEIDIETGEIKIIEDKESDVKCEKCGKPMVVKKGRYGDFLACTGYPKCRNTKRMDASLANEKTEKKE